MMFGSKIGGFVRVTVNGENGAALLNRLSEENIDLWDVDTATGELAFCAALEDLPAVRRAAHRCGCYVTIRHGGGVPFYRKYMRKHKNAWFTAVFVFLLLMAALSLVWQVEVVAEEGTSLSKAQQRQILAAAEDCGIKAPLLKSAVDAESASAAILEQCPFLSWVGLSPRGVTMEIHVAERKEDTRETAARGHVVAEKDGKIRKILVLKGQKQVEIGDRVKAGDVLISGDLVYKEEGLEPVYDQTAAKGSVFASVWYEGTAYAALERETPIPTGRTAGIITAEGHGQRIILWGDETDPFSHSVVKERAFSLFGWTVTSKTYCEASPRKEKISAEEAKAAAEREAGTLAKEQVPAGAVIVKRNAEELHDKNGAVGVKVILECEEEIGKFTALPEG